MWTNAVDVSDDAAQNRHLDVDAHQLWESWPGNNRPILRGKFLCGPDSGVIGCNIFLIVFVSSLFQVFVAARLHAIVIILGVGLVVLTLYALSRATWTEAGILPRASFQKLQGDYQRLPVLPPVIRLVSPDGHHLVTPPEGTVEVASAPIEIDPTTGEKVSLKFCSTCKIFRPARAKHCFTEDHQVLTSRGFLSLSEILHLLPQFDPDAMATSASVSDSGSAELLFASYDQTSQAIVYAPTSGVVIKTVTELIEFTQSAEACRWSADADAYGLTPQHQVSSDRQRTGKKLLNDKSEGSKHSNHLSIIVDPGHDMFVKKGSADGDRHHQWDDIRVRDQRGDTREERPYQKHAAASLLSTDQTACLKMLAVASAGANMDSSDRRHFTQALGLKTDTQIVAFLEVYGYWLGAGTLDSSHRSVQFLPKTTKDKKWLNRRLERVGLFLEAGDYKTTRTQTSRLQVDVTAPAWSAYFFKEYEVWAKAAATAEAAEVKSAKWMWSWVWRLAKQDVRSILVGLRYADGKEASSDENVIYTSSVRFRDEIQRAALHAGYASRIHLAYKKGAHRGFPSGSSAIATGASWCVTYSEHPTAAETILHASTDVKRVAVPGGVKVWCVTVNPHNLIIVRRVGVDDNGVVTKASVPIIVGNCRDCNNCVEEFDHHCPWVSACIGKRNYRYFVGFVLSVTLTCAYVCVCSIILVAKEAAASSFTEALSAQPVACVLTGFTFLMNWCLCSLSCYHLWLIGQDMTTNEHIKSQRGDQGSNSIGRRQSGSGSRMALQPAGAVDEELGAVSHDDSEFHPSSRLSAPPASSSSSSSSGRGCLGRFHHFFFRPIDPSYFDLRAPLGRSVFARTLIATSATQREEERRAALAVPIAQPVYGYTDPAGTHSSASASSSAGNTSAMMVDGSGGVPTGRSSGADDSHLVDFDIGSSGFLVDPASRLDLALPLAHGVGSGPVGDDSPELSRTHQASRSYAPSYSAATGDARAPRAVAQRLAHEHPDGGEPFEYRDARGNLLRPDDDMEELDEEEEHLHL